MNISVRVKMRFISHQDVLSHTILNEDFGLGQAEQVRGGIILWMKWWLRKSGHTICACLNMSFAVFDKLFRFRVDADIFDNGLKTLLV